ncbi:MAG: RtcB family protein, partial [Gammaproteobacteria bacterium]
MELTLLDRKSTFEWQIPATGNMRVPAIIYASEELIREMDAKVYEQAVNVAMLPGIVGASYAMPDAHWGYGFPIGGVAAFDANEDGVVSAGGVGFDISCGVRALHTGLTAAAVEAVKQELACAPINSPVGQAYLGAMRAGINCALANRQIITHLARAAFSRVISQAHLTLCYDVSHNTCKLEEHVVGGKRRRLYVHRKGATRAFGPGHPDLPDAFRPVGQPVLIGGSMGTSSYVLV